jgi:hypothetical protein
MEEIVQTFGRFTRNEETILMWVAIGLALAFVGVLILDFLRRRKQDLRYQTRSGSLGQMLRRPFRRARVFYEGLRALDWQGARSRQWEPRKHTRKRK